MNGTAYQCQSSMLVDVILAEYHFRYQSQFKESVCNDLETANKYSLLEHDLYLKENRLPAGSLKKLYDDLRQHPCWYLREGLVKDCAARGRCCARECGCCEKRLHTLPKKGMSGHCSLACPCCNKNIGDDTLETMYDKFKAELTSKNPICLDRLAFLYFGTLEKCPHCEVQPYPNEKGTQPSRKEIGVQTSFNEQETQTSLEPQEKKGLKKRNPVMRLLSRK